MENLNSFRINKYLKDIGYCSRRIADKLLKEKRVTLNGVPQTIGAKMNAGDEVKVDGKSVTESSSKPVYIAFNKPVGIASVTDAKLDKDNIIDFIKFPKLIFPIGGLDKTSEGLILLTSDTEFLNKVLNAKGNHEKEYIVTVNRPITPEFIEAMKNGVPILGTVTQKCEVVMESKLTFKIVLAQSLNRQIRRMCKHFDYKVMKLSRIRIMNIKLDVPVGEWRNITLKEMREINRLMAPAPKIKKPFKTKPKTVTVPVV